MMNFLKWMFGSFWRFLGILILAGLLLDGCAVLLLAIRGQNSNCETASQHITMQAPDGNSLSLNIDSGAN